ncbi:Uncharacterised protein [Chlamydia trachomatis]|nr:Uncharacterised protein [Chlamydia trachomatis]
MLQLRIQFTSKLHRIHILIRQLFLKAFIQKTHIKRGVMTKDNVITYEREYIRFNTVYRWHTFQHVISYSC